MNRKFYRLFNLRYKENSIVTRTDSGVEYLDKIKAKISKPNALTLKSNETTIKQSGNTTTITVFFKGGTPSTRSNILKKGRIGEDFMIDLSNDRYRKTNIIEFVFLWNEYNSTASSDDMVHDADPGGKGGSVIIGG